MDERMTDQPRGIGVLDETGFLAERAGKLEGRFGCVTPDEAIWSHQLFAAALRSQAERNVVFLD